MPVPKKRLGHSDQMHRRANWKATVPAMTTCPNCHNAKLMHVMCGVCGFYNGRIVSERFAGHDHAHDHNHDHDHDHDHE